MNDQGTLRPRYTVARFWRCALQVNPAGYHARYRGAQHGLDAATYNQRIVDQY